MKKLKAAVVGFGFMGVTHAKNILENSRMELAAIVDKNPENIAKNLRGEAGNIATGAINEEALANVRIYSSFEDCLAAGQLDFCVIAVHTNFHYAYTKLALEAGLAVFVEKPFCLNVAEGQELIELAEQKNLLLMVGQVVRFMTPYQKLKHWIDSGEYGRLNFLSLTRFAGVPAWGQWKEKQQQFGSSGGALFDLVVHDLDYVQWVLGKPAAMQSKILPGKLSRHDYLTTNWEYSAGMHVKIEGGNIFHAAFPFQAGFIADFEHASVVFSSSAANGISVATETETSTVDISDAPDGYATEMAYFADCLGRQAKPEKCMPASALQAIEICHELSENNNQ